jgi:uncharacterized membrane protein YgaE (UPF0421/DUF939 family)
MHAPAPLVRAGHRLLGARRTFAQVALATGGSWALATVAFGYRAPFFAPIAAVIVLNSPAQRGRRAVEVVVGVATGIAVADLLVLGLGTGGWQLVAVAILAMVVVTAAGGGPLVVTQAAVAAMLVVVLQPPTLDLVPHRFFHAVTGGAVALAVSALLPPAPDRHLRRAVRPVVDELVATLEDVADALHRDDLPAGRAALRRARHLDERIEQLRATVEVAEETARMTPIRRRQRGLVDTYADAVDQLDLTVRDTRVLARATVSLLLHTDDPHPGEPAPPELGDAVLDLADAVRALGEQLADDAPADPDRVHATATRRHAGAAAARTRPLFGGDTRALAVSRVVGQIRSTGMDLLRGSGLDTEAAQRTLYDAPDPPPRRGGSARR